MAELALTLGYDLRAGEKGAEQRNGTRLQSRLQTPPLAMVLGRLASSKR